MKTFWARALTASAGMIAVCAALTCVRPPAGHLDLDLRINEVECVLKGVNPFLVWSEKTELPPYASNLPKQTVPDGGSKLVNAYAPWVYAWMMPFAPLPRPMAWFAYCLLMAAAAAVAVRFSRPAGEGGLQGADSAILTFAPLVAVSYLAWSNVSVGNFIIFVLAFSVLLGHALSRGNFALAGVCWALAMAKPQSAALFAVPLLMRGMWKPCVAAGAVLLASSLPPAVLCRVPVFDLLLQGPAANAELFEGCGTWPKFLCGYFGNGVDIAIGLAIGALLCLWMTWLLRREKDWLVYLMPAAVCSSCWTYTQAYSHAMGWFLAYAVVKELLRDPRSKAMRTIAALSLVALPRFILAWHGLFAYMGWRFPMSEFTYRSIDSLNSTCTLALAAAFCIVKSRENAKASPNLSKEDI
jgi:hypothetical protein